MLANRPYDKRPFAEPSDNIHVVECPLCSFIMNEPVQCPDGHIFCRSCVKQHRRINKKCPTCHARLPLKRFQKNPLISNMIADAVVRCGSIQFLDEKEEDDEKEKMQKGNVLESCGWTGKLHDAQTHYDQFQFANTLCPLSSSGCYDVMLRSEILDHVQECPYRLLPCQWCQRMGKFKDITRHNLYGCMFYPVACPNNYLCEDGTVFQTGRSQTDHHLTVYLLEQIDCKFASTGCTVRLPRKDMLLHEIDAGLHIDCLLKALIRVERKLSVAESKLSQAGTRIYQSEARIARAEESICYLENNLLKTAKTMMLMVAMIGYQIVDNKLNHFTVKLLFFSKLCGIHVTFVVLLGKESKREKKRKDTKVEKERENQRE
jgi:hypothetical protein